MYCFTLARVSARVTVSVLHFQIAMASAWFTSDNACGPANMEEGVVDVDLRAGHWWADAGASPAEVLQVAEVAMVPPAECQTHSSRSAPPAG